MLERVMASWPEPDWIAVQPFPFTAARRSFTGSAGGEGAVAIRYFRRPRDGCLVATADFGPRSEGAPGQVHGGSILTVLDEALGAAAWLEGHPVLTARLTTEFRKSVPVGARLLVETRLVSVRHSLVSVAGSLVGADKVLYAAAEGRFMKLDESRRRELFGRA